MRLSPSSPSSADSSSSAAASAAEAVVSSSDASVSDGTSLTNLPALVCIAIAALTAISSEHTRTKKKLLSPRGDTFKKKITRKSCTPGGALFEARNFKSSVAVRWIRLCVPLKVVVAHHELGSKRQ